MAITTLDGAIAGMQHLRLFNKALTGTMVAARPHALRMMAGIPSIGGQPWPFKSRLPDKRRRRTDSMIEQAIAAIYYYR